MGPNKESLPCVIVLVGQVGELTYLAIDPLWKNTVTLLYVIVYTVRNPEVFTILPARISDNGQTGPANALTG
jgi:hypothetical protein